MLLEGGVNFRDMGGGPTRDGRRVREGALYRSGTMHALTDADVARFATFGVSDVFDLRTRAERDARPPRLPSPAAPAYHFVDHQRASGNVFQTLREAVGATDGGPIMTEVYRRLPYEFIEPYRRFFEIALSCEGAFVFNCAAGKDRTGGAAALLLSALGAEPGYIQADYLESGKSFDLIVEMFVTGPRGPLVAGAPRSLWVPILETRQGYLEAMFEGIAARSGTVEAYLEKELGVGEAERERLRAKFLA